MCLLWFFCRISSGCGSLRSSRFAAAFRRRSWLLHVFSEHLFSLQKRYAGLAYESGEGLYEELADLQIERFRVIVRTRALKRSGRAKTYRLCMATPFFWAYVSNDGGLYTCSAFLGDSRFVLGDLRRNSFADLWESERRRENFSLLRNGHDITQCRENCRMDSCNEYLWALVNPPPHVNFI